MHFENGTVPEIYRCYIGKKFLLVIIIAVALGICLLGAICVGAAQIPLYSVIETLLGHASSKRIEAIVWNIRLPQALAAILAGAGLAISGAVMQSILRNPLGSPFTLGISHAAAFGAALSVMLFEGSSLHLFNAETIKISNPLLTTFSSFLFSIIAATVIIAITRIRGATSEIMVLSGVAMAALFTASTMLLQYFADDVQLAAIVYWSFGDTARASWMELTLIGVITIGCSSYFLLNSWNYNTIDMGDETARGLGVSVGRVRLLGMLLATTLTAVIISFLGIIGFVGLVVPHIIRRIIGSDHRFLLPACLFFGGFLLLLSDIAARLVLLPHSLPVSVLTAFLGAPVFFWLIILGGRR